VPGPAVFGAWDVPLLSFEKNVPGDGLFRIEGSDLASLRLVVVPGSTRSQGFLRGNGSELWSFNPGNVVDPRVSADGGRTWRVASTGLTGRIASLFRANGVIYAVGDGAYRWDGSQWRAVSILVGKAGSVFQLGDEVFIQDLPGDLWRLKPIGSSLSELPICPVGQSPLLDVVQTPAPGDQPGTGAADPEAAFNRAFPTIKDYKMYEFGSTNPYVAGQTKSSGPVWIVADSRTFISLYLGSPGQNSWFAHPATFLGCRAPVVRGSDEAIRAVTESPTGATFAQQFPKTAGSQDCTVRGGGPFPGISVSGTCLTEVQPMGSSYAVSFTFTWDASKFHYAGEPSSGELQHTWSFIVDATGTVAVQPESGNFPPQYVR